MDRLIPPVDEDMDALDDEKIIAVKEAETWRIFSSKSEAACTTAKSSLCLG